MARAIVTAPRGRNSSNAFPDLVEETKPQTGVPSPQEKPDTYKERLFKYIPAEVVTLYLGLVAIIASATDAPHFLGWVIFFGGLVGTPFYLWRLQKVTAPLQLLLSTLAFAVWIFALGGPFKDIHGYKQVYGAVLLPLFTFFVAGFSPPPSASSTKSP